MRGMSGNPTRRREKMERESRKAKLVLPKREHVCVRCGERIERMRYVVKFDGKRYWHVHCKGKREGERDALHGGCV